MEKLKFKIVPYGTSLKEKPLFEIEIEGDKFHLWYNEIGKRFNILCNLKTEEEKLEYMKHTPVFDIYESIGCAQMSIDHLSAMSLFLKKNYETI